jgi:hypothetical protein
MSDWMPNLSPDQMRAVMARQPLPGAPPIGPGGLPVGPGAAMPSAPPVAASAAAPAASPAPPPRVRAALPVNEQQAQLPRPSDDPAISPEMRKALQPTRDAMGALDARQKHVDELESQISAIPQVSHDQYKPPLWKKIAAPFVGALAGRNAEPVVSAMLDGPYNRAVEDRAAKVGGLRQQLEAERGISVPLANDQARVSQEGFRNWMEIQKEQREKTAFQNETGDKIFMEVGADGQPHYFQTTKGGEKREVPEPREQAEDRRKRGEDSNTPAPGARPEPDPANKGQYRVKTKGGGYAPWAPRTAEEGAMVGDPRATTLFNREHPGREPKPAPEQGVLTGAEAAEWKRKTSADQGRLRGLIAERSRYAAGGLDTADADKKIDEIQARLDKAEDDIKAKRKGGLSADATPANAADVFNVTKWKAANPKGDVNAARAEAKKQGLEIKE